MANIGIYYGSTTGNTQEVAEEIADKLGVAKSDLHDVSKGETDFSNYDVLLFGSSTLGLGDLQDDWEDYIDRLKNADVSGKKVALFGCGDSSSYSDTFCDAMGKIYHALEGKGCQLIGEVPTDGYTYDDSEAVVGGRFVGLPIDNDNESSMTSERIANWVNILKAAI
ncbi:flavodoxin FldA [Dysgonomonas sp. 25]|uniref:flavodoxin FldA n=1 Tax=Dysgonomonas sp. 25 TaxID=2302933 RepID=UPI0013D627BA|nr:flavodoxin FldA [Dysgonomonas sp. 25]NDV70355.1 flavodoxin FldA [Dysgonomonas sp. 25]